MKKYLSLALVMFFLITSTGHAASYEKIQVSMNNSKIEVIHVPIIMMDGKKVSTQSPSFVRDDRTLVPIRFIEDGYGASVTWVQETYSVIVNHKDQSVTLTIDSPTATINGEKKILDKGSIPRLAKFEGEENSRTMVPLSFISEALGFEADWDYENGLPYINSKEDKKEEIEEKEEDIEPEPEPETNSTIISKIDLVKGSTSKNKLIIEGDKGLEYETIFIEENLTFIIDIQDSRLLQRDISTAPGFIQADDQNIKTVKYSQFSTNPDITRVAIELKRKEVPNIVPISGNKGLTVSFNSSNIEAISKEIIGGEEAIVVDGGNVENMKVTKLKNPERIVIDLLDSVLSGKTYQDFSYDLGFIKGVRVSQFSGDKNYSPLDQIVRIVLDVKDGEYDPNIKVDDLDNKIIIYPEKSFWEDVSYEKVGNDRHFILKNLKETGYRVDYDSIAKTIIVSLPSENIDLKDGIIAIDDGLLDKIIIERGAMETKVSLKFVRSVDVIKASNDIDEKIHLIIKRDSNVTPKDRLIVIDPGHGGKDPGAISVTGRTEKEFNLTFSKKLDNRLQDLGYNTLMTRNEDVFIELRDRSKEANRLNADIFVSIHANAFSNNSSVEGIEVLYCPAGNSQIKEKDQHPLAKMVLDEVLKTTGAKSRGVVKRPNLAVLRQTKMPAILFEAGFLTNHKEEKLLFTDEYQNKLLDGLVRGIENYFEIN